MTNYRFSHPLLLLAAILTAIMFLIYFFTPHAALYKAALIGIIIGLTAMVYFWRSEDGALVVGHVEHTYKPPLETKQLMILVLAGAALFSVAASSSRNAVRSAIDGVAAVNRAEALLLIGSL